MNKILSVSIAAYNVEKYISETLNSLVVPSVMDDLEVLIISDGSTDKTNEIAQSFVNKYPNTFKLVVKENGGWGSTVNTGIKEATGKYFKQLDGDDYFKKENIEAFVSFLKKAEEDMVLSPYISFDDKTGDIIERSFDKEFEGCFFPTDLGSIASIYKGMNMHAACFKTSLLKDNKIFIEEHCFYTDVDLMIQACCFVKSVNYFCGDVYCYRTSREGQSCSTSGYVKHIKEHQKICLKCFEKAYSYRGNQKVKDLLISRSEMMALFHFYIALIAKQANENVKNIKYFDKVLKEKYPLSYEKLDDVTRIKAMRITRFHFLALLRLIFLYREKKRESK